MPLVLHCLPDLQHAFSILLSLFSIIVSMSYNKPPTLMSTVSWYVKVKVHLDELRDQLAGARARYHEIKVLNETGAWPNESDLRVIEQEISFLVTEISYLEGLISSST